MIRQKTSKKLFLLLTLLFILPYFIGFAKTVGAGQLEIDYNKIEQTIIAENPPIDDSEWYSPKIKMLIITSDQAEFILEAQKLANWKTLKGVPTKVVNQTEWSSYEGRDMAEKLRNCIKDYYIKYKIEYVLIAGDTEIIPIRYTYNPDTIIVSGYNEEKMSQEYKPTDMYYSDLTGSWDKDNDGVFGESLSYAEQDEIDWEPLIAVGRFPAATGAELATLVNKTIYYENAFNPGVWMNNVLLAGAIQKGISSSDPDGEEESILVEKIIDESLGGKVNWIKLVETNLPIQNYRWTNLSWTTFNQWARAGNSIVFYAGHGASSRFDKLDFGTDFFYSSDAISLNNYEMPSLFYADACSTNFYDDPDHRSLGEYLILNARGGAIGYIGAMRLSWFHRDDKWGENEDQYLCEMNRGMSRLFFKVMFQEGYYKQGVALKEMRKAYLNSWWMKNNPWDLTYDEYGNIQYYNIHYTEWERKNVLTYNLLGDPETDIFTAVPKYFDANKSYGALTGIFPNPTYYQGQNLKFVIQDQNTNTIPNAQICVMGEDGAYNVFYSDKGGNVEITLPNKIQKYNFTVYAHNMIPYFGSFETIPDNNPPKIISDLQIEPNMPTVDDNIKSQFFATDSESGISSGYLVLSANDFKTYGIFKLNPTSNPECLEVQLEKLDPAKYKYILFVYDYALNSNHSIWSNNYILNIPLPLIEEFAIYSTIGIVIGVIYFVLKNINLPKKYERNFLETLELR
ncbi:MAG: C25 family cysteine peptidase [Promethearchaeota archaeon]